MPSSGIQAAYKDLRLKVEDTTPDIGIVVVTVSWAGVPGLVELGVIEHVGAKAGEGWTAQDRATEPLKPPTDVIVTAEVEELPGLTVEGVRPEARSVKSGFGVRLKVAINDSVDFAMQAPVPEHRPPHPAKV